MTNFEHLEGDTMDQEGPLKSTYQMDEGAPKRQRKAGKRAKFLARAKKLGDRGKFGKGFHIDEMTYSYWVRVFEILRKNEFGDDEEKDTFIENSMKQTEGNEANLCKNQMISRILEMLISVCGNPETLLRFAAALTPELRTTVTDPYGSHIIEKLFDVVSSKWVEDHALSKWFRKACLYVYNNFEEFMFNRFANHVLRMACQCLGGTTHLFPKQQAGALTPTQPANTYKSKKEPEELTKVTKKGKKILLDFAKRFITWPQFNDILQSELTSGFNQCLLITLKELDSDLFHEGIANTIKVLKACMNFENKIHIHTLENCFIVSGTDHDQILDLHNNFTRGKLLKLAKDAEGHYLVERILSLTSNKEMFEEMFDELSGHFQEIYDEGFYSIFVSLVDGCKKNDAKQGLFLSQLGEVKTHLPDSNFIKNIVHFGKPFKTDKPYFTDIHGTQIIQSLLEFHKPTKIVSSILELGGKYCKNLAMDPKGSHVIQNFFKSPKVGEKSKDGLLTTLEEHLVPIACSKFGSRILDEIWVSCTLKCKGIVAGALCKRIPQLNADKFGKFISEKFILHLYKKNVKEWTEACTSSGSHPSEKKKSKKRAISELIKTEVEDDQGQEGQGEEVKEEKSEGKKKKKRKKSADI